MLTFSSPVATAEFSKFVGILTAALSRSYLFRGFPASSFGKEFACNSGDPSLIPRSGRSAGEGMATHSSILGLPWWLR